MPIPITSTPVLVTGATGFVAAEIVKQLLGLGHNVRGTTRDVAAALDAGHLSGLSGSERLELIEADLLEPRSFDQAMADCEYVIHVASPYVLDVDDPQTDLVEPAVKGTVSILEAAAKAGTMKRIILTSSFAAIAHSPGEGTYSERDWNSVSTSERNAYSFSKAEAERSAWRFVEDAQPSFDLVAMNPTAVIGPSIVPRLNQSHILFTALARGDFPGIISLNAPYVDVRDVARAHILGMETPSANGRYLLAAKVVWLRDLVRIGKELGIGDRYKLPSMSLENGFGNVVARLAANLQPKGTRDYLKTHIGKEFRIDNSRSREGLGLHYRDVDQTIADAWTDLEKWGHL